MRSFIIGDPGDGEIFTAYLGVLSARQELQLAILKTGKLLQRIGNREITKTVLLHAITVLNEKCEGRLGQMVPTVTVTAQDPAHRSSVPIYCEDPALSLQNVGVRFRAFRMDEHAPIIEPADLDLLLGFAATFLSMDDVRPESRKKKKAWNALRAQSAHYGTLLSRM